MAVSSYLSHLSTDISREFRDISHVHSNRTQTHNLWHHSHLSEAEFAAILNAALPEIMWEKARRARRRADANHVAASRSVAHGQERGVMLRNAQGKVQWVSEEQLRAMAAVQHRQHQQHQKTKKGLGGGR